MLIQIRNKVNETKNLNENRYPIKQILHSDTFILKEMNHKNKSI